MKRLILKFIFLFYKYYDKGSTKSIAYLSALSAFILILFMNILFLLIFFDVLKRNSEFSIATSMYVKYLLGFLILIPTLFTLSRIFPKEEIIKMEMDKSSMRKGYFLIVSYVILSIVLLVFVINVKK